MVLLISGTALALAARLSSGAGSTGGPPDWLTLVVKQVAVRCGDARPSAAHYVVTNRQAAMDAVDGGVVDSNESVYYVVLSGHFVDYNAKIPSGVPFPSGSVITFTVAVQTQSILDFSIGNIAPDVGKLGTIRDLVGIG